MASQADEQNDCCKSYQKDIARLTAELDSMRALRVKLAIALTPFANWHQNPTLKPTEQDIERATEALQRW